MVALSLGLVLFWRFKRRFSAWVFLFSLIAYAGAILLKEVLQYLTARPFEAAIGGNLPALGAYFGVQTVLFEVGGAFLAARYAVTHGRLEARDAEGFGIGLAFWENGVLIGGSLLLNYALFYLILNGGPDAQQLYAVLSRSSPALFYPPTRALPLIGLAILERVSSLLSHFSWGYLCVMATALRKKKLLGLALPMGLVDFFQPYASAIGLARSEVLFFLIGLASLGISFGAVRGAHRTGAIAAAGVGPPEVVVGRIDLTALVTTNLKRAVNFGRIYIALMLVLNLLVTVPTSLIASSTTVSRAGPFSVPALLIPLQLPLFVVIGSIGGLMIFSSDKAKGVYEYLIAYGVDSTTIFWSIVAATLGIVTILLTSMLVEDLVLLFVRGATVPVEFIELALFYSIPLSYSAAVFMSMAGMIWSSLTTRVTGVNSPVGVAPILGVGPVIAVLLLSTAVGQGGFLGLVGGASLAMVAASIAMAFIADRKMARERFLSSG